MAVSDRPTMQDISDRVGVSKALVSLVFRNAPGPSADTRQRAEVAVTGYDDSTLAQLAHIDMTSVSQEPAQQAARAVDAVVERLDRGRAERIDVVLEPRLVVRRTTARPDQG